MHVHVPLATQLASDFLITCVDYRRSIIVVSPLLQLQTVASWSPNDLIDSTETGEDKEFVLEADNKKKLQRALSI
jgi:hypothetical protein